MIFFDKNWFISLNVIPHVFVLNNSYFKSLFSDFLPYEVKSIIAHFESEGFSCYLIRGVVRDTLLGLKYKDIDILVDGSSLAVIESYLEKHYSLRKNIFSNNHVQIFVDGIKVDFIIPVARQGSDIVCYPDVSKDDFLRFHDFSINSVHVCLKYFTVDCIDTFFKDLVGNKIRCNNFYDYSSLSIVLKNRVENTFFRGLNLLSRKEEFEFEELTKNYFLSIGFDVIKQGEFNIIRFEGYWILANRFCGKPVKFLADNGLLDLFLLRYLERNSWVFESNNYSKELDFDSCFVLDDLIIRYGDFKNRGWFGFKSLNNSIVQVILKEIESIPRPINCELYLSGGIQEDWITYDIDLFLEGDCSFEEIEKYLLKVNSVGFKYHFFIDISYVVSEFKILEKTLNDFRNREDRILKTLYVSSNYFSKNGKAINNNLKIPQVSSNLYVNSFYWPYNKFYSKLNEGHVYKSPILVKDVILK